MAKTAADFRYLASNIANSDRPEYATHFRDASAAIGALEAERDALRSAALALLDRLGQAMPSIDNCVTMAALHGVEYRGPALQPAVHALQDACSLKADDK